MECPACKDILVTMELGGVEIDHCFNCRGVWLDAGELAYLLEQEEKSDTYLDTIRSAVSSERPKKCPICSKKMEKIFIGDSILLDRCVHGIWSDKGELLRIIRDANEKTGAEKSLLLKTLEDMFTCHR